MKGIALTNVIKMKSRSIVYGTGLIALDLVISSDPSIPIYPWAGGTCGNVLTILSYLGWNAYPIARMNGDSASLRVKEDMNKWGVKLDHAEQTPSASTPIVAQQIVKDKKGNASHKFIWTCPQCGSWLPFFKPITISSANEVLENPRIPNVFFFDRVSPGILVLAKKYKELGSIIFFDISSKGNEKHNKEAISLSHVIKYSKEQFDSSFIANLNCHPILEIQTLGQEGLRYRTSIPNKHKNKWMHLDPIKVEKVIDTCGCGDWTTAGIIFELCKNKNVATLLSTSQDELIASLDYGQALASWNCSFEGARGGMYQVGKKRFQNEIREILHQRVSKVHSASNESRNKITFPRSKVCPSC